MGIDLDAARAARREEKKEAPTVTFEGQEFNLPVELPFDLALSIGTEATPADVLRAIFGLDQYEKFLELEPSLDDINVLFDGISDEYGLEVGESQASSGSSKNTSKRSRRTSVGSTR